MSLPQTVVEEFLDLLANRQAEAAIALLTDDIEWRNSGSPTLRGPKAIDALRQMERRNITFRVDHHHIAANGDVVLTDRTDYLGYGRFETSFWVCGTFVLREGRIAVWHDHFASGNVLLGSLRGLAQLARPGRG
jgi:limonene-1,2-epoxide hydrolase